METTGGCCSVRGRRAALHKVGLRQDSAERVTLDRVWEAALALGYCLKANGFRFKLTAMFNRLHLEGTRAKDGRVAVSSKTRRRGQVRALVKFAVNAGWLMTSPIASMQVTGDRQQSGTNREVYTFTEVEEEGWEHARLSLAGHRQPPAVEAGRKPTGDRAGPGIGGGCDPAGFMEESRSVGKLFLAESWR